MDAPRARTHARTHDTASGAPGGGTQATLVADVPPGSGTSPRVSFGNRLGWLTVFGTAALAAGSFSVLWQHRRRRRTAPSSATA